MFLLPFPVSCWQNQFKHCKGWTFFWLKWIPVEVLYHLFTLSSLWLYTLSADCSLYLSSLLPCKVSGDWSLYHLYDYVWCPVIGHFTFHLCDHVSCSVIGHFTYHLCDHVRCPVIGHFTNHLCDHVRFPVISHFTYHLCDHVRCPVIGHFTYHLYD